ARLGLQPAAIVHATGSGGTQAGLSLGAMLHQLDVPVYGINVCDNAAWFQQKITRDIQDWQQRNAVTLARMPDIHVIDGYVGEAYAVASDAVLRCIADLAVEEGIVLDPVYTGKAFYGLLQE